MSVALRISSGLVRRVPRLEARLAVARWRRRNRSRAIFPAVPVSVAEVLERVRAEGVAITDVETLFGDPSLFERAAERADELRAVPREKQATGGDSKTTFLTKLATGSYGIDDPFARLALHPSVLAVVNGYLGMRSTLRALDLWLTEPTPGPAIQTQLWHRDGDDVMNLKMFVYFSDVTRAAGPLCYAPRTHPLGDRLGLPAHDEQLRSTDEQLAQVVRKGEWLLCEGRPGTVVLADTCGYHKQQKPEAAERMLLMSQYVSGTPFVPRAVEIRGADPESLTDDEHVAVFDRLR